MRYMHPRDDRELIMADEGLKAPHTDTSICRHRRRHQTTGVMPVEHNEHNERLEKKLCNMQVYPHPCALLVVAKKSNNEKNDKKDAR